MACRDGPLARLQETPTGGEDAPSGRLYGMVTTTI